MTGAVVRWIDLFVTANLNLLQVKRQEAFVFCFERVFTSAADSNKAV